MADKFTTGIRAGSTGVSLDVVLRDTTGVEMTGKVYTDVTAYYWRQGGSPTAIAAANLAAIASAWASGGFKEADSTGMPGSYRFDPPDAAFAAGAEWVEINVRVAGSLVHKERFGIVTEPVITGDAFAVVNGSSGNVAIKSVVDTISAAVDTEVAAIKGQTDQLMFTGGRVNANAGAINADANAAANLARAVLANVLGVVGGGSSTTSIVTSSLDPAAVAADQFKGRIIVFDRNTVTVGLRGQGAPISGSTAGGVLSIASANALTTAPAAGDTFTIT